MQRQTLIGRLRHSVKVFSRKGSDVARPPLPPPSPIKNMGEYIEPALLKREHPIPSYRSMPKPSSFPKIMGTIFGTIAWTWMLCGLWFESDHITGSSFPWPDAKSWTDKELGIPDRLPDELVEVE